MRTRHTVAALLRLYALWLLCASLAAAADGDATATPATPLPRYTLFPAYQPASPLSSSALNYSLVPFNLQLGTRRITGRVLTLHSPPELHFSVYPPPGGCGGGRSTVSESAAYWQCDVAMNAGFFQIDQPAGFCLNAVVSDGRLLQEQAQYPNEASEEEAVDAADGGHSEASDASVAFDRTLRLPSTGAAFVPQSSSLAPFARRTPPSSLSLLALHADSAAVVSPDPSVLFAHHNVQLGLTSDGRYFVGHVNHSLLAAHSAPAADSWHFTQLLSGVVWLVRDGASHVEQSWESEEDQSTPIPAASFTSMKSARTAIGHDGSGRLMLVLVEGKSGASGVGLAGLAELCVRVGMVNGINTDGGGSATLVQRGVLVNEPSESSCPNAAFDGQTCERPVATIACLHASRQGNADSWWSGGGSRGSSWVLWAGCEPTSGRRSGQRFNHI